MRNPSTYPERVSSPVTAALKHLEVNMLREIDRLYVLAGLAGVLAGLVMGWV